MANRFHARLSRIERGRASAVPNVVEVATGEADDEAFARFTTKYGRTAGNVIVMPSRATDDELADLEPMWADQQRRLQAEARDQTRILNEGNDNGHDTRRNARSNTPSRRILSASRATDATRVASWKPG